MNVFKVIMQAQRIPIGSNVTKRTGEFVYKLKDSVKIYDKDRKTQTIEPTDGTRFLIDTSGSINVVSNTTELVWIVNADDLLDLLENNQ